MTPVADIDALWRSLQVDASAQAAEALAALRVALRGCANNPHAQWLLKGCGPPADANSAQALCEQLIERVIADADQEVTPHKLSAATLQRAALWLRWVYRLVRALRAAARAHGVPPPEPTRLLAITQPPNSPFGREAARRLCRAEHWRAALLQALQAHPTPQHWRPRSWQAAMLLSAALCGGLIERRALKALQQRLNTGAVLPRTAAGVPYLDIHHPARGAQRARLQRWLVDPISAWLLERCPAGPPSAPPSLPVAWRRLLDMDDVPHDLGDLIEGATILWLRWGTALDVALMRGTFPTHDIEPRLWQRLSGASAAKEAPHAACRVVAADGAAEVAAGDVGDPSDEAQRWAQEAPLLFPWVGTLLDAARRDAPWPTEVSGWEERLRAAGTPLPPSQAVLLSWLATLATQRMHRAPSGRRRLAHQVHTLLPAWVAVQALLSDAGEESFTPHGPPDGAPDALALNDPTRWSEEELDGVEQLLLGHAGARRQRTLRLAWVGLRRAIERAAGRRHRARDPVPDGVDAQPLSEATYRQALQSIERLALMMRDPQSPPALWEMVWLILVLAFRTGLRRSEILGLRLLDVSPLPDLTLVIRPTAARRLKSTNAQRIVPAGALLQPDERERLHAWVQRRWRELGADPRGGVVPQALLFDVDLGGIRSSPERAAERVIEALHEAEPGAHLHHLRHGFATWTYLALRAVELPAILEAFAGDPDTQALLRRGNELRAALFGPVPGSTRQVAFALARLLGHSSPLVSLEHYVHAQAIVTWALAVRECERLSVLGDRDGVARRALQSWREAAGQAPTEALGVQPAASRRRSEVPAASGGTARSSSAPAARGRWPLVEAYAVLCQLRDSGGDPEVCLGRLATTDALEGFGAAQQHALVQRARELAQCLQNDDPAHRWPTGVREAWVRQGPNGPYLVLPNLRAPHWLQRWQQQWPHHEPVRRGALPALRVHLLRMSPRRHDVTFYGPELGEALQTYLRLLVALGLHEAGLRVVLRRYDDDTALPAWIRSALGGTPLGLVLQEMPRVVERIRRERADSFAKWLGLEWSPGGNARPDTLTTALLLLGLLSAGDVPLPW